MSMREEVPRSPYPALAMPRPTLEAYYPDCAALMPASDPSHIIVHVFLHIIVEFDALRVGYKS